MKYIIALIIAFGVCFLYPFGGSVGARAQDGAGPPVYILPPDRVQHGVVHNTAHSVTNGAGTISHEAIGGAGDVVGGIFDGAGQMLGGVGKIVGGAIHGADRIAGGAIHGSGQIIEGVVDGAEAPFVYEQVPVYDSHHKMLGYRMLRVAP
jgi:hypothetical protein